MSEDPKPVNEVERSGEPVPSGPIGWIGYVCALGTAVALAATLVAFGYGFIGWGVIGAICTVALLAALLFAVMRARRHDGPHLDPQAVHSRFAREAAVREEGGSHAQEQL